MADLAVWQRTIVDEEGNVIPGAEIEVRREEDGSLATLYADRAGETPLANPLAADMSGFVRFFAQGDAYTITAVGAGSTRTWRFDPTGRLKEFDRISDALAVDDGADTAEIRKQLGAFSSVAEVQSRHIPAVIDSIRTEGYYTPGDGGGAQYTRATVEPSHAGKIQSADGAWWSLSTEGSEVNVRWFGAKGNYVNSSNPGDDDSPAFQMAVDFLKAKGGGTLFIPPGRYRLGEEIDCYRPNNPRIDIEVKGAAGFDSRVILDFFGADKAAFRSVDPDYTNRCSPISFSDLMFETVTRTGGTNPAYIWVAGWGESRLNRVRFGPSNNTQLRGSSTQNLRGVDVVSFFGGKSYSYKRTSGVSFDVHPDGRITSSADIFTASNPSDVGKIITIVPAGGGVRRKYTITSVIGPREVEFSETPPAGLLSGAEGHFQPAVASMTAGSNLLFASPGQEIFTEDDIGRIVYVRRAKNGFGGGLATLRGIISQIVGPHAVRLVDESGSPANADRTVQNTFFGTPVFDFGTPDAPGLLGAGSSDVKFFGLHIEAYAGVAFIGRNIGEYDIIASKIHGRTQITDDVRSDAAMWLDNAGLSYEGQLDTSCSTSDCRVYVSNQNKRVTFPNLFNRNIMWETAFRVEEFQDPGGFVEIGGMEEVQPAHPTFGAFRDDNSPSRVLLTGFYKASNRDAQAAALARNPQGPSAGSSLPAGHVSWSGTAPSGASQERYRWRHVGDICYFAIRLEYENPGSDNTRVNISLPSDMPAPTLLAGTTPGEIIGHVGGFISTSKDINPEPSLAMLRLSGDDVVQARIELVDFNNGVSAILAVINGWYFTE